MKYPIDVTMPSGAVSLGPDVVCDGFRLDAKVRVQTHIHVDHMDKFHTSKGKQEIVASEPTIKLLIAEFDADLPYRVNIMALGQGQTHEAGSSKVTLIPSGHMLGSVQVLTELECGMRVGYSGDFQWPLHDVIQVDGLVVDSTYGSPNNVRGFTQGACEEQFVGLLHRLLARGPVFIKAHRGTLQRALQIVSDEVECPIVASERLSKEVEVYREFGYTISPLIDNRTREAREVLKSDRHIRVYGTGDNAPSDLGKGSKITLSAYFTHPDNPMTEYSERAFAVAMSNHADFEGTLEYIRSTNAKFVVTDNTRGGKGYQLAAAIKQRLGVEARPSSGVEMKGWGV